MVRPVEESMEPSSSEETRNLGEEGLRCVYEAYELEKELVSAIGGGLLAGNILK